MGNAKSRKLQADLIAAYIETESIRKQLKRGDEELRALRIQCTDLEEEWGARYDDLQSKYEETQVKLSEMKKSHNALQMQLSEAKTDLEKSEKEISDLTEYHEQEQKLLDQVIDSAINDRSESEFKWKKEFEQVRHDHSEREAHLMQDCEFQLRNMQKACADNVELAEKEKMEALNRLKEIELGMEEKQKQIEYLTSCERETGVLTELNNTQLKSIEAMTSQIEYLNAELQAATKRVEHEIENSKKIQEQCDILISENQRETTNRIETETLAIAYQWEQKLYDEMARITNELNQIHLEERQLAVEQARAACLKELEEMKSTYEAIDATRKNDIASLNMTLQNKQIELETLQFQVNTELDQSRMLLEQKEFEHMQAEDREKAKHEVTLRELRDQYENEKQSIEEKFRERLQYVRDEFAVEIANATAALTEKHQKNMQTEGEQFHREHDDALQELEQTYKLKLSDLENKLNEREISQQKTIDEIKNTHTNEVRILDQCDHRNRQDIETLQDKCVSLTNLFQEMRKRYERRESRAEDLLSIEELKHRSSKQENELRNLTGRLLEYELFNTANQSPRKHNKSRHRKMIS